MQFCNRDQCVSADVQNCPECMQPITSRKKLFGAQAGVDLEASFQARSPGKKRALRKLSKKPSALTVPHHRNVSHLDDSKLNTDAPVDAPSADALDAWAVESNVLDGLDSPRPSGSGEGGDDLDLSFEVGQDDISDSDGEDDRKRARTLRAKSKKVYTFEIEPADEEDEEEDEDEEERALEKEMTLMALQEQEQNANAANEGHMAEVMAVSTARAKQTIAALIAKRAALSKSTQYTKGVETTVSPLEASTLKMNAIKAQALETMMELKRGANTLSDSERQELLERLVRLHQDLEVETGAAKTEMEVVNLAMEGVKLIKALHDSEAETLLFSIIFGQTLVSRALVQNAGTLYEQEKLQRGREMALDTATVHGRARSASPSSTRTSVRTYSAPPTARTEDLEEEEEELDPFESLGNVEQMQMKQVVNELIQKLEDEDAKEKAAAAAAIAAVKAGEAKAAAEAAGAAKANAPQIAKRKTFFGFGSKAKEEEAPKEHKKKGGMFSLFTSHEKVEEAVKEVIKEPEMPEPAQKALAHLQGNVSRKSERECLPTSTPASRRMKDTARASERERASEGEQVRECGKLCI